MTCMGRGYTALKGGCWAAPVQKACEAAHGGGRVLLFDLLVPVVAHPHLPLCVDVAIDCCNDMVLVALLGRAIGLLLLGDCSLWDRRGG